MNTRNFIISGTNFWNPGDDIVRDGVIRILKKIFPDDFLNFLFYNFNADFFPLDKFSGIHNMLSRSDLKNCREFIDGIIIAGLSAGLEIKDLYNWIIENRLTDRVYLIGAGYENDYVAHYINEEPEKTIFQNARIIVGRTKKKPSLMDELNLSYFHLNCPSILSVKNVKTISNEQKIKSIVFSIQLPQELGGITNHTCALPMYELSIELLKELQKNFQVDIIAHHKSEYFHFLKFVKENNYPVNVIFSSFYQDLFDVYPDYDLMITTRLHASLFANGFGIPGIIINDTDRHTHCLDGFKYSFWTNNKKNFYEIFNNIQEIPLSIIAEDIKLFKQNLLSNYKELLSKYFIINQKNSDENLNQFKKEKKISNDYKFDSEQKEQLLVRNLVKEGMTIFDVGAHLGKYTKLFSLLVGEKGKVFTFEPTKKSFLHLHNSIEENNCFNVKLYNNAVYDRNTKIIFNEFPSEYSSCNSIGKPQMENPKNINEYVPIINSSEVNAISLGDFLVENKIQKIDYLKIDVEGAEIFVLKGLEKFLQEKSINFIQFEISKKMLEGLETKASDVFNYLYKFDYEVHKIKDNGEIGEIVYDSNEFYENYIAFPLIKMENSQSENINNLNLSSNPNLLPIHFFTIVLNGMPFIKYHINVLKKLPFKWHWHIIEGVADLKHDTSWPLNNGGKINSNLHNNGLSKDGTTEYLNELKKEFPNNIFIYRKPNNKFWNGKLEMVNAPLKNIFEECLLWQIDSDELWTSEQIIKMRELFINNPEKTAAYFYCHYFVGEKLVITTRNTYGNNISYEWLRVWRFKPNDKWLSHEPPVLSRLDEVYSQRNGYLKNVATINPFIHYQTEINGLIFQHYAYVTDEQLLFKEIYYGYKNALNQWKLLQNNFKFPVLLKDYFSWVNDNSLVNNVNSTDIKKLAYKDKSSNWFFRNNNENSKPKKILFVRTDSIGDNILASSMLKPIKEKYDDAEIIIVCQNHIAELYSNCPYINKIISFDKKRLYEDEIYKNDFLENLKLIKPDLVLNTVYSREPVTDLISLNCDAENTVAFVGDNSNIDENLRLENNIKYSKLIKSDEKIKIELFRYKDFLEQLEIPYDELKPQMWLSEEDENFAEQFFNENNLSNQNTIALLPFAQSNSRIYERYDEVIKQFPDYNFIILGSEEFCAQSNIIENKLTNDLFTNQPKAVQSMAEINCFNLVGKTTIKQLAAIIKKSSLYLGAETSGAHIACAFDIPNVVLVGGGHFNRFFPYSNLTTIVSLPLECYQCNWDCKYEKSFCVKDIEPIIIVNAVKNVLKNINQINSLPTIFVEGISYWLENYNQNKPDWIEIKKFINPQEVNIIEINEQELSYKNLIEAAEIEIDKNNFVLAKKYLELVINNDNNNIDALNDLAVLEIMNQNWEAAQNILMKIIQIEPNNEIAKNNLIYFENKLTIHNAILESENFIAQEKYAEAKKILENILNSEPENIDALNNLAVIEIYLQNYKSAIDNINKILSLEPTNEIALNNLDYLNSLLNNTNQISYSDESHLNENNLVNQLNKNKITVATSIAPKNLDKQKIAIQSWIDVGFSVISINTKEEIEFLEQQFKEIKFIEANRDARNFAEKPYIYFDNVMQSLQESGSEICGIINSDIILNVNSGFYNYIFNLAKDSFVYGSRTDVNSLNSLVGNFYEFGFDIFFFNRNIISLFPKSDFCLGLPWWDYWIVIIPLIKNIKLKRIMTPVALHLWHETNYNIKYWIELGKIFINYLNENNFAKFKKIYFQNNLVDQINIISFELLLKVSKKSDKVEYNNLKRKIEIKSKLLDENDISPKEFFQSFFVNKNTKINTNLIVNKKIDEIIQKGFFEEAHNLLFELYKNNPNDIRLLQYITILAFVRNNIVQAKSLINLLEYKNPDNFTTKKIIDFYHHITEEKKLFNDILVSAIVSVYNSEKFIKGCLDDLLNQTLYKNGNLEIIVVNSGSEQNEEKIILDYKNKYDNIIYIKTEQRETIYQAWNRAIKIAKGKFITNANTDDRHSKIAFEKMLNAFQMNPAIDVVYADEFVTNIPNDTFDSKTKKKIIRWSNFVKEFLLFGCFIGPHPMWKKSLHDKFGYFDESLNVVGDYEFWLRISHDAMFYHLNEILGLYYYSENSVEHKNKKLTDEENENVQKKYILKYIQNIQELNKIENLLNKVKTQNNLKDYYNLAKNLLEKRKNGINLQSLVYDIVANFKNIINSEMGDDLITDKLIEIDSIIENNDYIIDNEIIDIYNQFKENYSIIKSVN